MNKGTLVWVKATVYTKDPQRYGKSAIFPDEEFFKPEPHLEGTPRELMRVAYKKPWRAIVLGSSFRITGVYQAGFEDSGGCLWNEQRHPVVIVEPLDTARYLAPYACRETDLEEIEDGYDRHISTPEFPDEWIKLSDGWLRRLV